MMGDLKAQSVLGLYVGGGGEVGGGEVWGGGEVYKYVFY